MQNDAVTPYWQIVWTPTGYAVTPLTAFSVASVMGEWRPPRVVLATAEEARAIAERFTERDRAIQAEIDDDA